MATYRHWSVSLWRDLDDVSHCPLTKLNGGLSWLHSADEDAVSWLTSYGSWNAYEKKKNTTTLYVVNLSIQNLFIHGCWNRRYYMLCAQELHNYELSQKSHLRVSFTSSTIRGWRRRFASDSIMLCTNDRLLWDVALVFKSRNKTRTLTLKYSVSRKKCLPPLCKVGVW